MSLENAESEAVASNSENTKQVTTSNRRRFLKVAGIAGIAGLAGCSGGKSSGGGGSGNGGGSDSIELSYWTLFTGGDGAVMKSIIDRFNEEKPLGDNISISRQRTPWEDHYDKLFTSMTGGNAPDMAIAHAAYLRRFQDTLTDITDYLSSKNEKYVASIREACKLDGAQYAVPMDTHAMGLYYNADLLNEAGVKPPFDSFSQFEEACNAVLEKTDATAAFAPSPDTGIEWYQWYMSVGQLGGQIVNDDRTEAIFNKGAGLEAAKYYHSVSGERGWDKPNTSEERANRMFLNGDLAMTVHGTWYVNELKGADINWNMMKPHITPNASQLKTAADSHTIIIPKKSNSSEKRIQAAVDASEWITQQNPAWGAEAGHLPAYNPLLESDKLRKADIWDKSLHDFMDMARNDQLHYWPQIEGFDLYARENWTWLLDIYGHNTSPQKGVNQGVKTWNSSLQN